MTERGHIFSGLDGPRRALRKGKTKPLPNGCRELAHDCLLSGTLEYEPTGRRPTCAPA